MKDPKNPNKGRKLVAGRKKKRSEDFKEGGTGQSQIDAWNQLSPQERAWIAEQQRVAGQRWVPPDNPARTPKQSGRPGGQGPGPGRGTDNGR